MNTTAKDFALWLTKCIVVGSIPGAVCWIAYASLGGFAV
tara:strand:- start:715 stop:831 length:117 start_codon:yes stop_codon:yes gene_type:complete